MPNTPIRTKGSQPKVRMVKFDKVLASVYQMYCSTSMSFQTTPIIPSIAQARIIVTQIKIIPHIRYITYICLRDIPSARIMPISRF